MLSSDLLEKLMLLCSIIKQEGERKGAGEIGGKRGMVRGERAIFPLPSRSTDLGIYTSPSTVATLQKERKLTHIPLVMSFGCVYTTDKTRLLLSRQKKNPRLI